MLSGSMVGEIAVLEAGGELRGSPFSSGGGPSDCLLPRAAAHDAKRSLVLVACAGIDVVIAYDAKGPPSLDPRIRKDLRSEPLPGERRTPRQAERFRAKVGSGPAGIAVDEASGRAWAWGAFDGTLTEITLEHRKPVFRGDRAVGGDALVDVGRRVRTLTLRAKSALSEQVERGRGLFHASSPARRIAADGRSCASCHMDARDDGLTWRTDDGPRQTPVLLGRIEGTSPYGWEGDHTLGDHFKRTMRRLGGVGLSDSDRDAIFAYVSSLTPPEGAGIEGALAQRGRELFTSTEVGCSSCHPQGRAVDGLTHDVKSRAQTDRRASFDTPSLRFVAASAPYFHDGRFATLEELLEGSSETMGHTSELPHADRQALLAYLETL
jgi:mono/diheme cytochrome c family protein